jgi:Thioesterase-like superfamily
MTSFVDVIRLDRASEEEHRFTVPDGWQQGRGAFGGLVLGALMNAMADREHDTSRIARAFTGDLCGPALLKPSRIVSRVLRRGSNQTNVSATLEQDGAVVAQATTVLASDRGVAAPSLSIEPPTQTPFEQATVVPVRAPMGPVFGQHYEYRIVGPMPFANGKEPIVLGWIREQVPVAKVTAAVMLARLDAFWPAIFSVSDTFRPMATVSFMAEFLRDPHSLDPARPMFYRGRAIAHAGGYVVETRELWLGDEPVALNQQTMAILA